MHTHHIKFNPSLTTSLLDGWQMSLIGRIITKNKSLLGFFWKGISDKKTISIYKIC